MKFGLLDKFPAPREVDRELYTVSLVGRLAREPFPAPLEVDRELYKLQYEWGWYPVLFPAPREGGR